MMKSVRTGLAISALIGTAVFPWPVVAVLASIVSPWFPLLPLSVGLLLDTLYYAPGAHWFPLYSVGGALLACLAYIVRGRLKAGIIE